MKIKDGAIIAGLQIEMRVVLRYAEELWKKKGQELVVTSGLDGEHSAGSMHYYGWALDFRTRYFSKEEAEGICAALKNELGNKYYVLNEGNHIHVNFRAEYV